MILVWNQQFQTFMHVQKYFIRKRLKILYRVRKAKFEAIYSGVTL